MLLYSGSVSTDTEIIKSLEDSAKKGVFPPIKEDSNGAS